MRTLQHRVYTQRDWRGVFNTLHTAERFYHIQSLSHWGTVINYKRCILITAWQNTWKQSNCTYTFFRKKWLKCILPWKPEHGSEEEQNSEPPVITYRMYIGCFTVLLTTSFFLSSYTLCTRSFCPVSWVLCINNQFPSSLLCVPLGITIHWLYSTLSFFLTPLRWRLSRYVAHLGNIYALKLSSVQFKRQLFLRLHICICPWRENYYPIIVILMYSSIHCRFCKPKLFIWISVYAYLMSFPSPWDSLALYWYYIWYWFELPQILTPNVPVVSVTFFFFLATNFQMSCTYTHQATALEGLCCAAFRYEMHRSIQFRFILVMYIPLQNNPKKQRNNQTNPV